MNIELYCYDHFIKNDNIVYDIGAHLGEMSNLFIGKGAKKVYAFEPSKFNFPILKENTKNNNIDCYNIAFNDTEYSCITQFKDCIQDIGMDTEQEIIYKRLDDFVKEFKIELPDFIKIDIEGMESIIFKTFDFLFEQKRPIIFTEFHVPPLGDMRQDYENNPHWRMPDEGGYDFNELKKHNYCYIDKTLNITTEGDFNPARNSHLGRILIPKEKLNLYS
jgi:FkbM family methyltransferase